MQTEHQISDRERYLHAALSTARVDVEADGGRTYSPWFQFDREGDRFGFSYTDAEGNEWTYSRRKHCGAIHSVTREAGPLTEAARLRLSASTILRGHDITTAEQRRHADALLAQADELEGRASANAA